MRHSDPRAAYAARTKQVHAKLARLQRLADGRFGHDPDAVHWCQVSDLRRVAQAEDKLVQLACAKLFGAIDEEDVLDCCHGDRPVATPRIRSSI